MLLNFKVSNYRSIGEEQILSLIPAPKQKDYPKNIIKKGKHSALNTIAIYGANASGKSNLLLAMSLLDKLLNLSARSSSTTKLPYDPFLLREGWNKKPTRFEISFVMGAFKYRYGLEFIRDNIKAEWLFRKSLGREVVLFQRKNDVIEVSSGFNGSNKLIDTAIEATRNNALFLSMCDMLNIEEAKLIFKWFRNFLMIDGLNTEREEITTVSLWENKEYREKIKKHLLALNLGIIDLDVITKDFEESELPKSISGEVRSELIKELTGKKSYTVNAIHQSYNKEGKPNNLKVAWKFNDRESEGTKRALHLSGPVVWALTNGGVLIIDEIEAKTHPIMTLHIIDIFLNKKTNPNNAQLIFATHDTNLLSYSKLRRDQIYFSEKNSWESTEVYSLSDFIYIGEKNGIPISEKERPDTDKEKRYIEGRYGAIPIIGRFNP